MKLTAIPLDGYYVIVSDEDPDEYAFIKHKNEVVEAVVIGEKTLTVYHSKGFNHKSECQNVIAQSKEVHPDLPLFDAPSEWGEDVNKIAENEGYNTTFDSYGAFIHGYNKHAEKYEFTREDMQNCFQAGMDWVQYPKSFNKPDMPTYLQSLQKPKSYEITEYEFIDNKVKILKWKEI